MNRLSEAIPLYTVLFGILTAILGGIWKIRGWVDQLRFTDEGLRRDISSLRELTNMQHEENKRRFLAIERRKW